MRIYLEPTVFDSRLKYIDLVQGDFIDASQPLKHFKTTRQESINRFLREMIVNKVEIQHSDHQETEFFYVPGHIYHHYLKNKNYTKIFARENLNNFLHECLPKSSELLSEKNDDLAEILSFEILRPNTLLSLEGQSKVGTCYAVVSGSLRVFKFDHNVVKSGVIDKKLKITDLIT